MPAYLLDTNHVGMAVDRATAVGQRVYEARLAGQRLGTCLPVLCEIEAGMRQVRRKAQYRRDLDHLLLQLRGWPNGSEDCSDLRRRVHGAAPQGEGFLASRYHGRRAGASNETHHAH